MWEHIGQERKDTGMAGPISSHTEQISLPLSPHSKW